MSGKTQKIVQRLLSLLMVVMLGVVNIPVQTLASTTEHETITISIGESKELRKPVMFSKTTWESSNDDIVTVSNKGVITGKAVGQATITCTATPFFKWIHSKPKVTIYDIVVNEEEQSDPENVTTIYVGETIHLAVLDTNGKTTWKSSDTKVASVTNEGLVTGVGEGTATIIATTKRGGLNFGLFSWGSTTTTKKVKIKVIAKESEEPDEPAPETKTYTVTFETNGGSTVESQEIEEGQCAVEPEEPVWEGYLFAGWYSDKNLTSEYLFETEVTNDITLYAKWDLDNENYCSVEYVFILDEEKIENSECFKNIRIKKGEKVARPENPVSKYAEFEDWYTGLDAETKFDFDTVVTEDISIFAKWKLDTTDTDGDGIYDSIEYDLGTDPLKEDTDGDGLNDYIEKLITTDPLVIDTDGDSVIDYDEDADGDTLSNGYEVEIGTQPEFDDSDLDGLKDNEEVNEYQTDPLKEDTDNDGASDIWEINNGFDPLIPNSSFQVNATTEGVSEYNLTSASVDIKVDGEQVDSLSIEKVNYTENPLVRNSLPGYMGTAYNFTVKGTFENATITFDYNVEIYGEPDAEFQPRIYYLNEERGCYEELENQTVANGKVSAVVNHFSTYILLNKIEFDKVWATEIKPPTYDGSDQKSGLDVVLAIDSSGSMSSNDGNGLRKEAATLFVEKLGDNDRAAIVDFDSSASVACSLTKDKEALYSAINSINSSGGTNLSNAVSAGINTLTSDEISSTKYKFIILLTDGEGSYDTSYSKSAVENDIQIYTIGLGSGVDESLLKQIANDTGGRYYFASSAEDLLEIYESAAGETIDYVTDSNEDGISDYYTKLIYEGKMPMADHLSGIDFSGSADYDGDGLKNGDEISIVHNNDQIFLVMYSDPTLVHSDRDGIDDYTEVQNGTSPLKYTVKKNPVDYLTDDNNFYAPRVSDDYQDGGFDGFIVDANAAIHIVWNRPEIYRDIMIDYFVNYSKEEYLDDVIFEATRMTMANALSSILGTIKDKGADYYDYLNKVIMMIDYINGTTNKGDLILIYQKFEMLLEEIVTILPDDTIVIQSRSITTSKITSVNITKLGENVGKVCDGLTIAVGIMDVADTIESFSAVSANNMAFEQNIDVLQEVIDNSPDKDAVSAAKDIKNKLAGDYIEEVRAATMDVIENAVPFIAESIMMKNPYTAAIVVIRNGIAIITGITVDLKQHFSMFSYTELIRATISLLNDKLMVNNNYYESFSSNADVAEMINRYLTHIAQLRILDERMFSDWQEEDGILGWFTDNSDVEQVINNVIENIKNKANELNLKLSANL